MPRQNDERGMSVRAFAEWMGVSKSTVQRALQIGRITRNRFGKIPAEKAKEEWNRWINPALQNKGPATKHEPEEGTEPQKGGTWNEARTVRERIEGRLKLLELQEKTGQLFRRDDIQLAGFRIYRTLRDRVLAISDRISPEVAAETNPREVARILKQEHRVALQTLSRELLEHVERERSKRSPHPAR